jgi:hypothetical protein
MTTLRSRAVTSTGLFSCRLVQAIPRNVGNITSQKTWIFSNITLRISWSGKSISDEQFRFALLGALPSSVQFHKSITTAKTTKTKLLSQLKAYENSTRYTVKFKKILQNAWPCCNALFKRQLVRHFHNVCSIAVPLQARPIFVLQISSQTNRFLVHDAVRRSELEPVRNTLFGETTLVRRWRLKQGTKWFAKPVAGPTTLTNKIQNTHSAGSYCDTNLIGFLAGDLL